MKNIEMLISLKKYVKTWLKANKLSKDLTIYKDAVNFVEKHFTSLIFDLKLRSMINKRNTCKIKVKIEISQEPYKKYYLLYEAKKKI